MANCTYRFTDADGNKRVIEGQAAFKAYLASGGLEYLLPGTVIAPALSKRQTETPAFKKWFGDSKVVDANGDPLVVYHGTDQDFPAFKTKNGLIVSGSYFANDVETANYFAGKQAGANVMPVFLSIKNPATPDDLARLAGDARTPRQLTAVLKKNGFDGYIIETGPENKYYVAFEPTQIKSATGNVGTFDVTNPDIRFSQRVPRLEPEDVLKPSTVAAAEAAIKKYKKAEPPDPLTPAERAYGMDILQSAFDAADRNKANFDKALDQIAKGLGGYAKKPSNKKPYRAVTKLALEQDWKADTLKDLLRGTIAVSTFEEAQAAIDAIAKVYKFDRIKNRLMADLTDPDGNPVQGKPMPTGYQDVLTNVVLEDGTIAEIQISTPEMLAAKHLGHDIYAFEREMPESPVKAKMVDLQKLIYGEAFGAYEGRAAKALKTRANSALSTSSPFSRTSEGLRGEGVGVQAVAVRQSEETVTGTSDTSKNMVPGGKDLKSKSMSPSIPESIGINVNQDGNNKYADKIVDGKKTLETRASDSLRPYVGKRVAIVRTGEGPAKAIGAVTIGEPIKVTTQKQFDQYRDQSLVPKDSKFDIAPGGVKYLYPLENPVRYETERDVGQGIVARKVIVPVTRAAQKNAAASRVGNVSADRFKRTEQLQQAVADLQDGKITRTEYNRMVDQVRPVYPYKEVPAVTAVKDARYALATGKGQSPEKAAKYGLPAMTFKQGDWAQLRLDIPSYQLHDTWVVSVHTPKSTNREVQAAYDAGPVVGYESVAALKDVTFGMNQKAAAKIATGTAKGTIATMLGKWSPISKADAKARADAALNDPAWVQVGMDPFRHSYFYNRDTMQPIVRADEVIQIGPLVLAKNPGYSEDVDITGAPFAFSKREEIVQIADDAARQAVFLQQKAEEAGYKTVDDFVDNDYNKFVEVAKQWREENPAEMMFQKRQTDTPEFTRWFKDSKVVDDQGKPLVVYHGTRET